MYARLEEAELARGLLEADGIPVALLDTQVAALGLGPALGGVRLLVPAWDEARALELLAAPPGAPLDEDAPTPAPLPGTSTVLAASGTAAGPLAAGGSAASRAVRLAVWIGLALAVALLLARR